MGLRIDARGAVVLAAERHWECLNCDATHVTRGAAANTQPGHRCRGTAGLYVMFVPAGTKGKIETVERGDWIGREDVQYDGNGRPVMATVTTRDDGQDCTVYAPCARGRVE